MRFQFQQAHQTNTGILFQFYACSMLTEKKDISEFLIEIKKTLDNAGTILAKDALEMMDSLVKSDSRRKQNWYVHEKAAPNTLATIFGDVHYHRTLFPLFFPS